LRSRVLVPLAPLAALAGAVAANASTFGLELRGTVPVICEASFVPDDASGASGHLREFCNNNSGYKVIVDHDAQLAGFKISVAGQLISLDPSGSTTVVETNRAGTALRKVQLEPAQGTKTTLSFRLQLL
jgi:hypothetical protein